MQEPYCNLEAIPLFKDGSYMSTEYMADIAFNFCMKETAGIWKVIVDLSRTDVPDTSELQKIRGNFPQDSRCRCCHPAGVNGYSEMLECPYNCQDGGSSSFREAEDKLSIAQSAAPACDFCR